MQTKKLLILGGGEMQVPIIKTCKRMGHKALVVDFDPDAPGFQFADERFVVSTNDTPAVLKIASEISIDGILTSSDLPVRTVAEVCREYHLKGLSSFTAEHCTNKYLLRKLLKEKGLKVPFFEVIENYNTFHKAEHQLPFPLVVKPVDSSASRGVSMVGGYEELKQAILEASEYSRSGKILVESFIDGREFSVESVSKDGKHHIVAITEKVVSKAHAKYFVEDRHIIPARITPQEKAQIETTVLKTLDAVELDNSAAHTEVKITENGPIIIEIGARLGGDFITSDLVPLATGVNMHENVIRIALGEDLDLNKGEQIYSGIQFLNFMNYEACIHKIELLKSTVPPHRVVIKAKGEGQSLRNSLDRLGYYICTANSREALDEMLNF